LIIAEHETTAGLITNGMRALLARPGQLARLRAEPELLTGAVEEIVRFDSPAQMALPSVASVPMDVAGQRVEAGEVLIVALLAMNRDANRFREPDTFDMGRDTGHLAFGHGIHRCLGAPLARLEGRIALGALISRFPDLELALPADSLERVPSLLINKLAALEVRRADRAAA
jgi:cytochrome P450